MSENHIQTVRVSDKGFITISREMWPSPRDKYLLKLQKFMSQNSKIIIQLNGGLTADGSQESFSLNTVSCFSIVE